MSKLIIRNGRVMDPASRLDAVRDVAIEKGRIAETWQLADVLGVYRALGVVPN